MSSKLLNLGIETAYWSFVAFFYYYLFMTLVQFNPFSFGFHPPTNIEALSTAVVAITVLVAFIKIIAYFFFMANIQYEQPKRISYFPSQRH